MNDLQTYTALTVADIEAAICEKEPTHYRDRYDWAQDCHGVSLAIVRSGLFKTSRVARGSCQGVLGQHSWVVVGDDCYDMDALILDATLWSYDASQPVVWKGTIRHGLHTPHGFGSIYAYRRPTSHGGPPIPLTEDYPLPPAAEAFLDMLGPLDLHGWMELVHAPVGDWPAKPILTAAYRTPTLKALIPIDIVGMVTDENPGGLYLP